MRALQLVEFGHLAAADLGDPVAAPGEVVIRVLATGICGSDIHGFTGENGRRIPGQIMGHESVGRIHAIGEGVDPEAAPVGSLATFNPVILTAERMELFAGREQHDPERRVIGVDPTLISAFAEYISVPLRNIVTLPETMPVAYGALIEPLAVALNAVRRVGVKKGDTVLVVGGGPIGQSTILAALHEGAGAVYVSEIDAARRDLCSSLGAIAIDPLAGAVPEQLLALHGNHADVAIDAVGIRETLADALLSTSYGGRVCLVGMGQQELALSAFRVSTEERSIVGSFCYTFAGFREAAEWVATGDPIFGKLISAEVTMDEANDAFLRLAHNPDVPGKVLVRLGE